LASNLLDNLDVRSTDFHTDELWFRLPFPQKKPLALVLGDDECCDDTRESRALIFRLSPKVFNLEILGTARLVLTFYFLFDFLDEGTIGDISVLLLLTEFND
jgi:hypothetical protein